MANMGNAAKKNLHAPAQCPVCGEKMQVTLEEKHLQFVEVFLRCRGSIKEVEKALGVSYPTVKNMLDAALGALGLDEKPELRPARTEEERGEILARLSSGELDVNAALEALQQLKGGK